LLRFLDLKPGMRVAELGAGGGYTTELLARAVGPTGVVYAQNSRFILERFAAKPWAERLVKPVMQNVVRVDRDFDDPLPPEAHGLDRVVIVLFYHDTVWMDVDRVSMNEAVFRALKPGGLYIVIDHSARPGSGYNDVRTLHRIEESMLRSEIEDVGFTLARESDFLRNAADSRDWNDSPTAAGERRGMSDRFALAFIKPTNVVPAAK
jgi:predicted methyltransferase